MNSDRGERRESRGREEEELQLTLVRVEARGGGQTSSWAWRTMLHIKQGFFFFFFFLFKKRRVELSVIWFAVTVEDSECDGGANMFIERKSKRNPTERERESSGEYRNQLLCCGVQESRNRVQLR